MSLRSTKLTFRIHRFETTIVVGAAILSVLVSMLVIWGFGASGADRCFTDESIAFTNVCQGTIAVWLERIARASLGIVPIFPVVAGLLLGAPIIARELESGTARLAWSIGPSRMRWFAQRAVPLLAVAAIAGLSIGLVADALSHALRPALNLDESFVGFRGRGLLIGVEALLIASVALALGAILGRAVPAFVLSLVLAFAIGGLVDRVSRTVLLGEAAVNDAQIYSDDDLYLDGRFRLPDGGLVTWEELVVIHPEVADVGFDESSGITSVNLVIPGARYHDVERREALALLLVSAAFVGLAAVTVMRRRPR